MRKTAFLQLAIGCLCFWLTGCGGALYKVAPLPAGNAPEAATGGADGLRAGATALEGDTAIEAFEANLPLAGVIAVDVKLANGASESLAVNRLRFDLRDAAGHSLKSIPSAEALKLVMKYYGNSFYTLAARQRTREDYEAVSLERRLPLSAGQERRGILFFRTSRNTTRLQGLTLSISGAAAPLSVPVGVK